MFLILSISRLQISAILQVKMAPIYFANFHKHAGAHTETRRTHLHTYLGTCAQTHTHVDWMNIQANINRESVCSSDDVTLVRAHNPHPECTHKPVCPVIMSSVYQLSLLNKFTTLTGGLCHLTLQ